MTIEKIDLNPEFGFAFSSCVVAGDHVYTAHHGGFLDHDGNSLESVEKQTEQCFKKLERTLEAAGATLSDVVKTTVLLKNARDFGKMNDVYRRQFTDGYPARTTIVTEFLDAACLIQIEAVAYRPK
jgi:2-iminobutanoate/2-iminopropanoate deaminase